MPITYTEGIYPYVTLVQDAHGCLHMFEGQQTPTNHPTMPKVLNMEADTFVQREDDIDAIKEYLTEDEKMHLSMGYVIHTKHIPDDYLIHD